MGQRRERQIRRPRSPGLADPRDPKLRAWVLGLEGPIMHRETCARLRPRGFITVAALAEWTFAGFPGWPANQSEMPLSIRLRLAERLSMTSPLVRVGRCLVPLLPPGALVNSPRLPAAPTMDTPEQRRTRDVLSAFQGTLIQEWWRPLEWAAQLLAEYEDLQRTFRCHRSRARSLWQALGIPQLFSREVLINGTSYRVPPREVRRADPRPKPSVLAILFLMVKQESDRRTLRRRLARARVERGIEEAWEQYRAWLEGHPTAQGELDVVLSPMTREGLSGNAAVALPARGLNPFASRRAQSGNWASGQASPVAKTGPRKCPL